MILSSILLLITLIMIHSINGQSSSWIFINESVSYTDAQSQCESLGTNLATITNLEEAEQAFELCKNGDINNNNYGNCWIGYYRTDISNEWQWESGSSSTYTRWGSGEPGNKLCAHLWPGARTAGEWGGEPCSRTKPILCDQPPKSIATSGNDTLYLFNKFQGRDCQGTGDPLDILRDFEGNATECMAKCGELNCDGFVAINSGQRAGQCFFRNGLAPPLINTYNDDRDCYETIGAYEKYEGMDCPSFNDDISTDVLRDYSGTAEECALKCAQMSDCVGFVRVNEDYNDNRNRDDTCYLRGVELQDPIPNIYSDDRDCFEKLNVTYQYYGDGQYTDQPTVQPTGIPSNSPSMEPTAMLISEDGTSMPTYDESGCVTVYRCNLPLFVLIVFILSFFR
mmetsp:Transcript_36986/g.32687  ORF Transcript_36986/g.32687 Transcript_36986/m.32687 type:complete len:396 (+) Transcript_36986:91-1278(+)